MIETAVFLILAGMGGAIIGIVLTITGLWVWDRGEPFDWENDVDLQTFNRTTENKHE